MRSIILISLTALIFLTGSSYTKSQSQKESYQTASSWTNADIEIMVELIPLLYKDVLRLDSCRSDASVLDSMNKSLEGIILGLHLSGDIQDSLISGLNNQLVNYQVLVDIKENQIKLVKKKSFWNGIKTGSGVTAIILFVIILL